MFKHVLTIEEFAHFKSLLHVVYTNDKDENYFVVRTSDAFVALIYCSNYISVDVYQHELCVTFTHDNLNDAINACVHQYLIDAMSID